MNKAINKERQSNFELMRIVSMLFIITWHTILHGGIFNGLGQPFSFVADTLLGILIVHVNSLVFITGYFNGDKRTINYKKVLKLCGTVWLYKVLIVLILSHFQVIILDKTTLMEELLPLDMTNYWFINCYIIVYILSPYLNRVTNDMNEKDFKRFLLILISLLSVLPTITSNRLISNNGYNIINFTIIYYLGSYFKRYPLRNNFHFKEMSTNGIRLFLIISLISTIIIRISLYYLGDRMCYINSGLLAYFGNIIRNSFLSYASPLVIIQTCLYCLFFESLTIKSKLINFVSKQTMAIYLIHDNLYMRINIYKWLNVTQNTANIYNVLFILIRTIVIIYVVASIIEILRQFILKVIIYVYSYLKRLKKCK